MASLTQTHRTTSSRMPFRLDRTLQKIAPKILLTIFGFFLMIAFLMPLGYMLTTAFKQDSQAAAQNAPLWPAKAVTFRYQDQDLPLYNVPTDQGVKQLALVKGYREDSDFIDPTNP